MNTATGYKITVLSALILALAACGGSDSEAPAQINGEAIADDPGATQEPEGLGPMVPTDTPVEDTQNGNTDTPVMDVPGPGVPVPDVLEPNAPDPDAPDPNAPDPNAPDPDAPDPNAPDPDVPEPNVPDPNVPEPNAPDPDVPEPNAPDPDVPEPNAPDPDAPDPNAPDPDAPDPDAPDPDGPALDADGNEILDPDLTAGSDLDRMVNGLSNQAASVLLELNRKISQGEEISPMETTCLGSFQTGLGDPLLAMDCGTQGVFVTDLGISTRVAAFYNTPECKAAMRVQTTDGCILQRFSASLSTVWEIPAFGGRPFPIFSGALIDYAIGNTELNIQNLDSAPTGFFTCNVNLEGSMLTDSIGGTNCGTNVGSIADRLDELSAL